MITAGRKVLFNSREDRLSIMLHPRRFAMKEPRRAHHTAAKDLPNRLMTQTNAENRRCLTKAFDNLHRYARIGRRAGSRRNYNPIGLQFRCDLVNRNFIIAAHLYLLTEFPQILNQVVSE